MRPPTWAAMAKPMKKNNRKIPASDASSPRLIWAYSLAKKNTGTNTSIVMPSMMFSTRNARLPKMLTLINGDSVRCSTR